MQVAPPDNQIFNQCKFWWLNLQLMHVAPSGDQLCNQCKKLHLVAKIYKASYGGKIWYLQMAGGAILWSNSEKLFKLGEQ